MNQQLDIIARDKAIEALSGGRFDSQAYLVLNVAESKLIGASEDVKVCTGCKDIDSFESRFADYVREKGNPGAHKKLEECLDIAVATFSEIYQSCDCVDETDAVTDACKRISELLGY